MKNNEIPSIPIEKLRFKIGIQKKFSVNWKVPTDLLKKTHKKSDNTNVKHEQFKATDRNKDLLDDGINDKINAPINGNTKIQDNIFLIYNIDLIN